MSGVEITLKLATSLDGRIALADGTSQWITGPDARARSHQMRAAHDGVLVGIGTALADDPLLTARTVPPPARQPVRIVADSNARTPVTSRLVKSAGLGPVVIAAARSADGPLQAAGAQVWNCGGPDGRVAPRELVRRAEVEGITSIMIEGGGQVAAAFLRAGLVDRLEWFRAPILIGGDGLPAVAALGLTRMDDATRWRHAASERIGDDVLDRFERAGTAQS
jgi:diaminohydroxyphosphoribosylaminopyrimidine deaminase / 5-amino-6-(5-phosphoribosylamino)uracil reductase